MSTSGFIEGFPKKYRVFHYYRPPLSSRENVIRNMLPFLPNIAKCKQGVIIYTKWLKIYVFFFAFVKKKSS